MNPTHTVHYIIYITHIHYDPYITLSVGVWIGNYMSRDLHPRSTTFALTTKW